MKKVAVFGNTGGGKSTLSRRLADMTGLPWVRLDSIQYRPGGGKVPPTEYKAAHEALPFLKAAAEIEIAAFDPKIATAGGPEQPGANLAAWLSHHGCRVALSHLPSGGREIGLAMLARAEATGAELIVLGAYGHSRLQQAVFGGTTRTLLEQTQVMTLFAH